MFITLHICTKKTLISLMLIFCLIYRINAQPIGLGAGDAMPSFPKGDIALAEFIKKSIIYPEYEKTNGITGVVFVTFIIDTNGKVVDPKILKKSLIGPGLNKEAIRIVKTMPLWNPAIQNGKHIKVQMNLPIRFSLDQAKIVDEKEYIKKGNEHYNLGVKKSEENNYEEAVTEFTNTLKYLPEDIDALYNRGIMYYKLNKNELACNDWKKIKELESPSADELLKKYCN
jgi:TonB family protein